jgi:hypothetical protein
MQVLRLKQLVPQAPKASMMQIHKVANSEGSNVVGSVETRA